MTGRPAVVRSVLVLGPSVDAEENGAAGNPTRTPVLAGEVEGPR
jgi:hypothetical protein